MNYKLHLHKSWNINKTIKENSVICGISLSAAKSFQWRNKYQYKPDKNSSKRKVVKCTGIDTQWNHKVKVFESVREAARQLGILSTSINNCLHKRSKTAGGLRWEYVTTI